MGIISEKLDRIEIIEKKQCQGLTQIDRLAPTAAKEGSYLRIRVKRQQRILSLDRRHKIPTLKHPRLPPTPTEAAMNRAHRLVLSQLLPRRRVPLPAISSPPPSAAVADLTSLRAAAAASPWLSALASPLAAFKSASLGISGALTFSSALVTVAEAKERPLPEFLPKEVVLYQYAACPFCNKVRAFLDYHDIAYKVVEVNPLSKKEIKWSDYKKVPILVVDGEQLVDSSDIIDKLSHKIHPEEFKLDDEEAEWRRWVDNHLVHVLSPNIYRNTSEALESFDYITNNGNFSFTERLAVKYAGAAAMYMVSKKLKKRHNITDERASLYEAAETWTKALNGRDFHGGSKPNLADLAVFGVLRPIRYLTAGKDMVANTSIGEWYQNMENAVGDSLRLKAQ